MFARFTRLPLRRCIHTQATRPTRSTFTRAALGVSAATAAYLASSFLAEPIALDSPTTSIPSVQRTTVSSKPSPPKTSLSSPPSDSTSETPFIPESEPSSERYTSSSSNRDASVVPDNKQEGAKGEQEGEVKEGEQQEGSGGAFNPQTGEINWDCPCLGGMAHGPCGPEFREAFSCFVFSEQDPKGIDCVEKFQAMQNCFRAHPEIYSDEIMDDDEEEGAPVPEGSPLAVKSDQDTSSSNPPPPQTQPQDPTPTSS